MLGQISETGVSDSVYSSKRFFNWEMFRGIVLSHWKLCHLRFLLGNIVFWDTEALEQPDPSEAVLRSQKAFGRTTNLVDLPHFYMF